MKKSKFTGEQIAFALRQAEVANLAPFPARLRSSASGRVIGNPIFAIVLANDAFVPSPAFLQCCGQRECTVGTPRPRTLNDRYGGGKVRVWCLHAHGGFLAQPCQNH